MVIQYPFLFFFLLFNSSIEPPNYPISVSLFVRHIKTILLVRREFQNELLIRAWKKERDCFSSFGSRFFFFWKNLARTIIDDEQCGVEDENENQQKNKDRKRKPKLDPSFNSITNSEVCARKTKILLPLALAKPKCDFFFAVISVSFYKDYTDTRHSVIFFSFFFSYLHDYLLYC